MQKNEVIQGEKYAAAQHLVHTVPDSDGQIIVFSIELLGKTVLKRAIKNASGAIVLLISDVLQEIRTNEHEFLPLSVFGLIEYPEVEISYTYDVSSVPTAVAFSIFVHNSIVAPQTFEKTLDFLTPKTSIEVDKRFEIGAFFTDQRTIRFTTDGGPVDVELGEDDKISFLSLRGLQMVLTNGTPKVQQQGIEFDSTTEIFGFANGEAVGAILYGDSGVSTRVVNAQGNVISFTGSGVLTNILLSTGERISFANGTAFGFSDMGREFPVGGAVGVGFADDALFLEHFLGCVRTETGRFIVNSAAKVAQISVII